MRVMLDANVLVSGIFWAGTPSRVLDLWARDRLSVLASSDILKEYSAVLDRLGRKSGAEHLSAAWTRFVFQHACLIDVRTDVQACRDPADDKYLACAVDGAAEYLVSGDIRVSLDGEMLCDWGASH